MKRLGNVRRAGRDQVAERELGWIPAFSRCGKAELQRIDALACGLRLKAGDVLAVAGKPVRQVMILVDGVVVTERSGARQHHEPGFVLGAVELHERRAAEGTAVAGSDVSVLVFGPAELHALLEVPGVRDGLLSPAAAPGDVRAPTRAIADRPQQLAPAT